MLNSGVSNSYKVKVSKWHTFVKQCSIHEFHTIKGNIILGKLTNILWLTNSIHLLLAVITTHMHIWSLLSKLCTNTSKSIALQHLTQKSHAAYAFRSSCSLSVFPTASGFARGSRSAKRLNHVERSLEVSKVPVEFRTEEKVQLAVISDKLDSTNLWI